jgi:hypothetical protein
MDIPTGIVDTGNLEFWRKGISGRKWKKEANGGLFNRGNKKETSLPGFLNLFGFAGGRQIETCDSLVTLLRPHRCR